MIYDNVYIYIMIPKVKAGSLDKFSFYLCFWVRPKCHFYEVCVLANASICTSDDHSPLGS